MEAGERATSWEPVGRSIPLAMTGTGLAAVAAAMAVGQRSMAAGIVLGAAVSLAKWAIMRPAVRAAQPGGADDPRQLVAAFLRRAGLRVGLACAALVAAVPLGLNGLIGVLIGQSLEMLVYMVLGVYGAWRRGSEAR